MKCYRERPSFWHVIVTCFAMLYLVDFAAIWSSSVDNPPLRSAAYFWPMWIAFGLGLTWIATFLIRELVRQFRLYRQWKSS